MRLVYAFLADAAQFTQDGKLWVLGGDFDVIFAPKFPVIHPVLTLVIKLRMEPAEARSEHSLVVELQSSEAHKKIVSTHLQFRPPADPPPPQGFVSVGHVLNFMNLAIGEPGTYVFHIRADGELLDTVPFRAELRVESAGAEEE